MAIDVVGQINGGIRASTVADLDGRTIELDADRGVVGFQLSGQSDAGSAWQTLRWADADDLVEGGAKRGLRAWLAAQWSRVRRTAL